MNNGAASGLGFRGTGFTGTPVSHPPVARQRDVMEGLFSGNVRVKGQSSDSGGVLSTNYPLSLTHSSTV